MNVREYFPLGKAHGKAFCNRTEEKAWLKENIEACKHSLIIAPRRFGKSSLCDEALALINYPTLTLNFNTCADENDIDTLFRRGISRLIGQAIGQLDKLTQLIKQYVTHLTPKLSIGDKLSLELTPINQNNPVESISEALQLLEKLLANKKKRAVLVLDEFQAVGEIAKGKGIEAAIRNVIQDNQYLVIIFSGSNRHLLKRMFEEDTRPLYKLCRKLSLSRISELHYRKHLEAIAKKTWGEKLTDEVFTEIMQLSERHPYYVNYLCDVIWTESTNLPTLATVQKAWEIIFDEEYSDINKDIASLSPGQRKLIVFIAQASENQLASQETAVKLGMPISSISGAVSKLIEKDLIEKTATGYEIINPVLKAVLLNSRNFLE